VYYITHTDVGTQATACIHSSNKTQHKELP